MERVRKRRAEQSGQAAVLIALSLFSLVVFLAMATNMGILVNDRIRMQNAADLASYAGAFEQARSLNRLTHINKRIFVVANNVRKGLTCPGKPPASITPEDVVNIDDGILPCNKWGNPMFGDYRVWPDLLCREENMIVPNAILDLAQIQMNVLAAAFRLESVRANTTAMRTARFTADGNFKGLGRPSKINFFQLDPRSPTGRLKGLFEWERHTTQFEWAFFQVPGKCNCPPGGLFPPKRPKWCVTKVDADPLDTWFKKKTKGPTIYFPTSVHGVPAKNFLDLPGRKNRGYFGAGTVPGKGRSDMLWAFSVAKPYGGHLGSIDPDGAIDNGAFKVNGVFIIKTGTAGVDGYSWKSFENAGNWDAFIEQYRARMAGLQEDMLLDPQFESGANGKIKPVELMMADLMRATKASRAEIQQYVIH